MPSIHKHSNHLMDTDIYNSCFLQPAAIFKEVVVSCSLHLEDIIAQEQQVHICSQVLVGIELCSRRFRLYILSLTLDGLGKLLEVLILGYFSITFELCVCSCMSNLVFQAGLNFFGLPEITQDMFF
jgi:hypothetical protein